jgi:hypothetical protein
MRPSPGPVGTDAELNAVACTDASKCMAVGDYSNAAGTYQTLAEYWDGSRWSITPSSDEGSSGNFLSGIWCPTSNYCVAVGKYVDTATTLYTDQPLVEAWDGTNWSVITGPYLGQDGQLNAVSCTNPVRCVAVGSYSSASLPAIESWDGETWSIQASPPQSALTDLTCLTLTRCVAVGDYSPAEGLTTMSRTEARDGAKWYVTASQNLGQDNYLQAVACSSWARCMAVGDYMNDFRLEHALVERWDGFGWSASAPG